MVVRQKPVVLIVGILASAAIVVLLGLFVGAQEFVDTLARAQESEKILGYALIIVLACFCFWSANQNDWDLKRTLGGEEEKQ